MTDDSRARWDARYAAGDAAGPDPDPFLVACRPWLPAGGGPALDLAGGAGRNALWLAREGGFEVVVADVSPVGLALARRRARNAGLALHTWEVDLERHPFPRFRREGEPPGWRVITWFYYLQRSLFRPAAESLAPGGVLVFSHPTRRNLERHPRPSARHLLEPGELTGLVPPELDVVLLDEGWRDSGRHEAHLVARRPGDG